MLYQVKLDRSFQSLEFLVPRNKFGSKTTSYMFGPLIGDNHLQSGTRLQF